jgi:hypothetical protein
VTAQLDVWVLLIVLQHCRLSTGCEACIELMPPIHRLPTGP